METTVGRDGQEVEIVVRENVAVECGWGRLVFGQTFPDTGAILEVLRAERRDQRDIAIYVEYPQVLVGRAPQDLFVDPSVTYRLTLAGPQAATVPEPVGTRIRELGSASDAREQNRIYAMNGMVTADAATVEANRAGQVFTYLLAVDERDRILGTVTGVDHVAAFHDHQEGASLWCLAVDPQAGRPGIGRDLVCALAGHFQRRGRAFMDLSVLHSNEAAIRLYDSLGFRRVPVLAVKRRNTINEPLFTSELSEDALNPYARLIADEATRRGIGVRVLDAGWGEMELSWAGRTVCMRESLSEVTSALAAARCDDKGVSRRIFAEAGLHVPRGQLAAGDEADRAFLRDVGEVVVKPVRGEQGLGVTVGVTDPGHLREAVEVARGQGPDVLLEEFATGEDLRVVVIDHEVVAAAVRRPAEVTGTGKHTVAQLIEKQSRRRRAATGGESHIPIDDHTRDTIAAHGYAMDDVLPDAETITVRRTANLHTGGTIHDVTATLHPHLAEVCITASHALAIPVVGMDLLVDDVGAPGYVIIEANERPGLANHEPQPTAARFVDLLFPRTRGL